MNNTLKLAGAFLALALGSSALAVPITGAINFGGSTTLNGDVNTATAVTFGAAFVTVPNSGAYSAVALGTAVTFNDFSFAPFASPTPDLWSFSFDGLDYSMTATSLTSVDRNPGNPLGSIELRGKGNANITGFDETYGDWILTFNTADNGATFSFSSSSSATGARVPDSGASIALLGSALVAMGLISRRRRA